MHTLLRRSAVLVAGVPLLLAAGLPGALAHEGDARIVTVVESVRPALPAGVVVQAQASLAAQLVVRNPTATPLEVLGAGDRPFLRISRAGVLADVASRDFFTTSSPTGAAPRRAAVGPARWVRVSTGDSWGWFDHRLHPTEGRAPADDARPARLAAWTVPLRYGAQRVEVTGSVDFRPLRGVFQVSAAPAPQGLTVQALPGRLPGLFLQAPPDRRPLTVLGRDGEPFLRFTDRGVEVNERSRTHVEDRQARGLPAGPPGMPPAFRLVTPGGSSYAWLDARLRYPRELPPEPALRASAPTVVDSWQVPVQVGGRRTTLTGQVTWVPQGSAAAGGADGPGGAGGPAEGGRAALPVVLGAAALVALAGAALAVRRARR